MPASRPPCAYCGDFLSSIAFGAAPPAPSACPERGEYRHRMCFPTPLYSALLLLFFRELSDGEFTRFRALGASAGGACGELGNARAILNFGALPSFRPDHLCPALTFPLGVAQSSGLGLLAVGRSWVQFEGWVLKEGGMAGGWHPRFFVVSGDRLEYFKEEKLRIEVKPGETASTLLSSNGFELDHTNVLSAINQPPPKHMLNEGDVIIGINGESVVNRRVDQALAAAPPGAVSFTVLRPKGRVALHGASVAPAGPRKAGGHVLTVNVSDSSSRRSRYNLVCADEKLCAGWIASIKEAIAASGMEEIKTAVGAEAAELRAHQHARL